MAKETTAASLEARYARVATSVQCEVYWVGRASGRHVDADVMQRGRARRAAS